MSRVLVVEDNVDLALNVAEILEPLASVAVAHDADAALAEADRGDIDLAIVDVRLPGGKSGVDLLPELKSRSPNVECVLVTGNATVDSAVAAVRHGAVAYVQKPFASRDLFAIAQRALDQARLRSERAHLLEALERKEALHRVVLDSVEAAILGIDERGRLVFVNRFAASLCETQSPESLQGRPFLDVFVPSAARADVSRAQRPAAHDLEVEMPGGDAPRVVRWSLTPVLTSDSIRTLAVGVDVTKARALERRAADAEALAAVGALTAGLAHEIRNPLNAAILQLEALVRGARKIEAQDVRAKIDERVAIVRGELRRLSSMLDDFLGLARPSAVVRAKADLREIMQAVAALDQPLADEQGIRLEVVVEEEARAVLADHERMKQVLINLVRNALDAMRGVGPGVIVLGAAVLDATRVEVRVEDEGVGLASPGEGLFRPFVTTKEAGTGLGLSIVKKLVELHGGEVSLRQREPRGAVASFTLERAAR